MKRFLKNIVAGLLSSFIMYGAVVDAQPVTTVNDNPCATANQYGDNNVAMDAQNPACHVSQSAVTLNSSMLGYNGPLSVSTQYSSAFGVIVSSQLTQALTADNAISLEIDLGARENRVGFTWGHQLNEENRVKFTAERLSEAKDFNFDSGEERAWIQQYAVGADYQVIISHGIFDTADLGLYVSRANSKNLDDVIYTSGGSTYLNQRHIAGATTEGLSAGVGIAPWATGVVNLTGNYDRIRYDRKYDTDVNDASGLGAGIKLTQLITNTIKADIAASDRKIYNLYEAGIAWLASSTTSTRLELGLDASRTEGHGTTADNRIQLSANYQWGFKNAPDAAYILPGVVNFGDLAGWTASPAVKMAQVLAIADQRTQLVLPGAPSVEDQIRKMLLTQTQIPVTVVANANADVNLLNYLPISDPSLVTSVDPTTLYLPNVKMTYNTDTGHLVGTPAAAGTDSITLTYNIAALKAQYGLDSLSDIESTTFVINSNAGPLTPWANQNFKQNNSTDMARNTCQQSDGACHVRVNQSGTVTVTLTKGSRVDQQPTDTSGSMFVYPYTGSIDYMVSRIVPPSTLAPYVKCLSCGSQDNAKSSTFQIAITPPTAAEIASPTPYLVNVYPSNLNGEGAPQTYKIIIDPDVPTIFWNGSLSVTNITTTQATANWPVATSNVTGTISYDVVLDNQMVAEGLQAQSYTFNNLNLGQAYDIKVTAHSSNTDTPPAPVTKTTTFTTATGFVDWPGDLTVAKTSASTATISWEAAQDDVQGATVTYHVAVNDGSVVIDSADTTGLSANLSNLKANQSYTVTVSSTDDKGSIPLAPKQTTFTSATGIDPNWNANIAFDNVTTQDADMTWSPASDDLAGAVVSYDVSIDQGATVTHEVLTSTTAHISGLIAGKSYTVTVKAYDNKGGNPQTRTADLNAGNIITWDKVVTAAPVNDTHTINLKWNEATTSVPNGTVTYQLYVDGSQVTNIPLTSRDVNVDHTADGTTFAPGSTHSFVIKAVDGTSPDVSSTPVNATTFKGITWDNASFNPAAQWSQGMNITWATATTDIPGANVTYALTVNGKAVSNPNPAGTVVTNLTQGSSPVVKLQITDGVSDPVSTGDVTVNLYQGLKWPSGSAVTPTTYDTSFDLTYPAGQDDIPGYAVKYALQVKDSKGADITNQVNITYKQGQIPDVSIKTLQATVSGLAQGNTYTVILSASDSDDALGSAKKDSAPIAWQPISITTTNGISLTAPQVSNIQAYTAHASWTASTASGQPLSFHVTVSAGSTVAFETDTGFTQVDITGLSQDTNYDISVTATDGASTPVTKTTNFTTQAAALNVTITSATATTFNSGAAEWTVTSNTGSSPITYTVQLCDTADCTGTTYPESVVYKQGDLNATFVNLTGATQYFVQVKAVEASTADVEVKAFTTPAQPAITVNDLQVNNIEAYTAHAQWTTDSPAGLPLSYHVKVNNGSVVPFEVDTNVTEVDITGLDAATPYTITVTATDGSSVPGTANTDFSTQAAALNLVITSATATSYSSGAATWTVNSNTGRPITYAVQLCDKADCSGATYPESVVYTQGDLNASFVNLTSEKQYFVQVKANDSVITEVQSQDFTTPAQAKITLTIDPFTSVTYSGATANWHATTDSGQPITYVVKLYSDANHTQEVPNAVVYPDNTKTTAQLTNLVYNTTYYLGVTAHDGTSQDETEYAPVTTAAQPVITLTMGSMTNVTDTTGTANWTSTTTSGLPVTYTVALLDEDNNPVPGDHVNYPDNTAVTASFYDLTAETTYIVQVTASDGVSVPVSRTKPLYTTAPSTITLTLQPASNITYNGAVESWTASSNQGHALHYSLSVTNTKGEAVNATFTPNDPKATTVTVGGLAPATTYNFTVLAIDDTNATITKSATNQFTTAVQDYSLCPTGAQVQTNALTVGSTLSDGKVTYKTVQGYTPQSGEKLYLYSATYDGNPDPGKFKCAYGSNASPSTVVILEATNGVPNPTYTVKTPNDPDLVYLNAATWFGYDTGIHNACQTNSTNPNNQDCGVTLNR